jgi:sugar phosphate isomerase/epimerase
MVQFCRWMAPAAAQHGIIIAIEPLNKSETNLINTAEEAAALVREIDHPNIRMLIDGYHWAKDQNSSAGILENIDLIVHAHVAAVEGRRTPSSADPCDAFFEVIRHSGFDSRLSFEGSLQSPEKELSTALLIMQSQQVKRPS